jgi:hypothetical protein
MTRWLAFLLCGCAASSPHVDPTPAASASVASNEPDAGRSAPKDCDKKAPLCNERDSEKCEAQCECGEFKACDRIATTYATYGGAPKARIAELFEKACTGGVLHACGGLADATRATDKPKALELYDKSCEGGDAWSCVQAGDMKSGGEGLPRDPGTAAKYYSKACDKKDALGCASLGRAYLHGEGVKRDRDKGIALLRMGLAKGISWAADELKRAGAKP